MRVSFFVAIVAFFTTNVFALSPAGWRSQSVYQVLTDRFARTDGSTTSKCNTEDQVYCGGTWQGIINHLDYIQNMGFTAIWISPVVENLPQKTADGMSYHGFWAQDIYSVNTNFGSAADLVALSAAVHARGMYLMVDVVTNHMGYAGCGDCVDYQVFKPFNSQSYYHPFCLINYTDPNSVTNCWEGDNTVSLPDLRTEDTNVLNIWTTWIAELVANYTIDGIRLDSTQQVDSAFFEPFQSAASGMHILGEVLNGDPDYVCPYQDHLSGVMNYPAYFWITQAFESTNGSISNLAKGINTMKSKCADTTLLGSFSENHDQPRFASKTSDISLAKNVIGFTILADGIPIVFAGQEQHYSGGDAPSSREATWLSGYNTGSTLYTWTAGLNRIRKQAISKDNAYLTYKAYPVYSDESTIVMRKGFTGNQIISVFSNQGSSGSSYTLTLTPSETGFTANQALVEVMGCTSYTTDSSGNLFVGMANGVPRVFYPQAQLTGSGICSSIIANPSTTLLTSTISKPPSTSTSTSKTSPACATPTATTVAVTFTELETTTFGQTIKLVGNTTELGNWNVDKAVPLSATHYTDSNPLWSTSTALNLAVGAVVQYKYIVVDASGVVAWERDPNHTYTVSGNCATATVSDSWQM